MTASGFIKDNMLIDPSMQQEIIRRAVDGNLGDERRSESKLVMCWEAEGVRCVGKTGI
jgi:hypothetical protein